jgi:GGDEF domain-containing protein
VNKTSIGIGAVMLVSAAAFIYFEEPILIRIASGVIFLIGAILLYRTLAASVSEGDDEAAVPDANGENPSGPMSSGEEGKGGRASTRRAVSAAGTAPANMKATQGVDAGVSQRERVLTESDLTGEHARAQSMAHPDDFGQSGAQSGFPHPPMSIPEELYIRPLPHLPADDPRAEFDYLVSQLLQVLKEHLLAHTTALFWINHDREQVIIGELATDSSSFTTARRLPLGTDLVSKVGLGGRPEIHADIPAQAERDLLTYYDAPEGIRSFVGVPLIFGNEVIAVLAADSRAIDSFGLETVSTIGRFCALVTTLLASYNQKFDLASDSRMLGNLDHLGEALHGVMDRNGVAKAALDAVTTIMDWDFATVILRSQDRDAFIVETSRSRATNMSYISEGVTVDIDGSVLRAALGGTSPHILDAPSAPYYRFHEKEVVSSTGELIIAPIVTQRRHHGLIVVEYREKHQYGSQDCRSLSRIADLVGTALETIRLHELTRDRLIIDEQTQMLSRPLLLRRLAEEQLRIKDAGGSAVFLIISIDNREELIERHSEADVTHILRLTGNATAEFLKPYDVLGRYDVGSYGLLLTANGTEEAYLKGEKIRKAIAGTVVPGIGGNYSITVSIAGCTLTQTSDVEHVRRIAGQALDRAFSDGGNCVKVV